MAALGSATGTSVLVDTNVVLDVMLRREPWAADAVNLLALVASGQARGFIAGHAVTTVHYIVEKALGRSAANTAVSDVLELLIVVPLESVDFNRALTMNVTAYEDAVQVAACLKVGGDCLVTRNGKDFKDMPVNTRTPGEIVALLGAVP